ncbi:MAG TPA: type II toxin-antitoxin system RelE/ParE family toxin [Acetobacteraceae bacterium]|nr:type II toxin-antitoxin system RelE/ParE family toxin [Acetobacteraceae bacterium]
MALIIPPRAAKEFAAVPRAVAKRLLERLERIAEDPFAPQISVKPLAGRAGVFRVRQGDWRALYSIENGDVIVERIGDRKVVYR